jgi:hypothetical protein
MRAMEQSASIAVEECTNHKQQNRLTMAENIGILYRPTKQEY